MRGPSAKNSKKVYWCTGVDPMRGLRNRQDRYGPMPGDTEMRLEDNSMLGIGVPGLNRTSGAGGIEAGGKGARGTAMPGAGDEVALSGLTEHLRALSAQVEADPGGVQRAAWLNELGGLVERGRYEPDREALSQRLIEAMEWERA